MEINTYSTWLEVDLTAIKDNVTRINQITGSEVMAVIEANGYGHSATPAAQAAVKGGATWRGVARIEEALLGRQGDEVITVNEIADRWGTLNCEVVGGLADRLPRIYIE
jgi:alanine racemase